MTEQTPARDSRTFRVESLQPTRGTARQHGLNAKPIQVVYFRPAREPADWGVVATLRRKGRRITVEPHDGTTSINFGAGQQFFAAPLPPMPARPCVNRAHAEATHQVRFSDGTSEDCCERHAGMYEVGHSFRVGRGEISVVSVEPITDTPKCASCFRPAEARVTLASPDPVIDGSTELTCSVHRAVYRVGVTFPGFPARADWPAISEFTVVSVKDLEPAPDPATVAEYSDRIQNFLASIDGPAKTGPADLPIIMDPAKLIETRDAWIEARAQWHVHRHGMDPQAARGPATHDWPRFEASIQAALHAEHAPVIQAIKLVRELTGLTLPESKAIVDAYRAAYGLDRRQPVPSDRPAAVQILDEEEGRIGVPLTVTAQRDVEAEIILAQRRADVTGRFQLVLGFASVNACGPTDSGEVVAEARPAGLVVI